MPIAYCTTCGRLTNSAASNYWLDTEIDGKTPKEPGMATQCYAAFVREKWVEGCVYKDISPMQKKILEEMLKNRDT